MASAKLHVLSKITASGLVAIVRTDDSEQASRMVGACAEGGAVAIEITFTVPGAATVIGELVKRYPAVQIALGAGTVLDRADVARVSGAGGRIIVSPDTNVDVISATASAGLVASPGYFTPSEALAAVRAGATALKLFPAEAASPAVLKAQLAVIPKQVPIMVVGGVKPDSMRPWLDAGATGFGLGGGLYRPGQSPAETLDKARAYVEGLKS